MPIYELKYCARGGMTGTGVTMCDHKTEKIFASFDEEAMTKARKFLEGLIDDSAIKEMFLLYCPHRIDKVGLYKLSSTDVLRENPIKMHK